MGMMGGMPPMGTPHTHATHYMLRTRHCTLHTAHYILYTIYYTLNTRDDGHAAADGGSGGDVAYGPVRRPARFVCVNACVRISV
jgi:hypothetical protein